MVKIEIDITEDLENKPIKVNGQEGIIIAATIHEENDSGWERENQSLVGGELTIKYFRKRKDKE